MKNYYFTFGNNHRVHRGNDLIALNNHWVRVIAESYGKAREIFIEQFSTPRMERGAICWSFQYEENRFDKSFFPLGEYAVLKQNEKRKKEKSEHSRKKSKLQKIKNHENKNKVKT